MYVYVYIIWLHLQKIMSKLSTQIFIYIYSDGLIWKWKTTLSVKEHSHPRVHCPLPC